MPADAFVRPTAERYPGEAVTLVLASTVAEAFLVEYTGIGPVLGGQVTRRCQRHESAAGYECPKFSVSVTVCTARPPTVSELPGVFRAHVQVVRTWTSGHPTLMFG